VHFDLHPGAREVVTRSLTGQHTLEFRTQRDITISRKIQQSRFLQSEFCRYDKEIRFDVAVEQLELRRGGEFVIDCMSSIEDTKGNNGESGELRVFCADQFPHGVALEYVRAAGAGPVRSLILSTAVCR
jgi:hypothetical protein